MSLIDVSAYYIVSHGPRGSVFFQIPVYFLRSGYVVNIGPLVFLVSADYF